MQSQKKHKMPKVERVNAHDYAVGYIQGFGSIEPAMNAYTAAKNNEKNSPTVATANFWNNIAGHVAKIGKLKLDKVEYVPPTVAEPKQ